MLISINDNGKIWFAFATENDMTELAPSEATNRENIPFKVIDKDKGEIAFFSECKPCADMLLYDDKFWQREITPKSIICDMIPDMDQRFNDNNFVVMGRWMTTLTISQKDRMFDVSPEGLYRETNVACHGYGVEAAYARLAASKGKSALERLKDVFEFWGRVKRCDYFPIVVIDNESCEMQVVNKEDCVCQ